MAMKGVKMKEQKLLVKLEEILNEFDNLEESYRKIYNDALDIEDLETAQKMQLDIYLKIRKLKEWKDITKNLNEDIVSSDIIGDIDLIDVDNKTYDEVENFTVSVCELDESDSEEQIKTVRDKMQKLSDDGEELKTDETDIYESKNPVSMHLFGKTYIVENWGEILMYVCRAMVLRRPYIIAKFDIEPTLNSKGSVNFSYRESDIKSAKEKLSNGLWVAIDKDANSVMKMTKTILELCGFKEKDLTIQFEIGEE